MARGIPWLLVGTGFVAVLGLTLGLERAAAEGAGTRATPRLAATPSLERRARGIAAVEGVRFTARGGSALDFDRRYPASLWESRAVDVIAKSRCLLERYGVAVDDRMLTGELERMRRQSQDPTALDTLFEVLDRDPALVKECLVRPILVDRLFRRSVAWDPDLQRGARAEAARLGQANGAGELESMGGLRAHRRVYRLVENPGFDSNDDGPSRGGVDASRFGKLRSRFRSVGHVAAPVEDETAIIVEAAIAADAARIETVSVIVPKRSAEVWWREVGSGFLGLLPARLAVTTNDATVAVSERSGTAEVPFPERSPTDSWVLVRNVLDARAGHTAVWTGSEMIVWGGSFHERVGGIYDPATDSWTPTTSVAAPSPRSGHTAVWTGREMIIWEGSTMTSLRQGVIPTACTTPTCAPVRGTTQCSTRGATSP